MVTLKIVCVCVCFPVPVGAYTMMHMTGQRSTLWGLEIKLRPSGLHDRLEPSSIPRVVTFYIEGKNQSFPS